MHISHNSIISGIGAVAMFFGGYFLRDLRSSITTLQTDFKSDHDVLVQLVTKDSFLNGKVKATPVDPVKPLSHEIVLAAKRD